LEGVNVRPLRKIVFLLEDFPVPSPSQQLLDRFLIGYPRDGKFHKLAGVEVAACLPQNSRDANLERRVSEHHLTLLTNAEAAVADADAVVIVPRDGGTIADNSLLRIALQRAPEGAACFVHGVLASSLGDARQQIQLAKSRKISLLAGTPLAVTWRLPDIDLPLGTPLSEALIVVQGKALAAELSGLDGLLPIIERRKGGEAGVKRVRFFEGQNLWRAGEKKLWSWPLLAAAISRSDSPQGDPVKDGRTQDLVGLGLVPKLATEPRGWLLEHRDALRSAILVLDGVVADYNFAVRARDGRIFSAQLFRPPPPGEHHFSKLVAALEDFFRTGKPPWPVQRNLLVAGLLEIFARPSTRSAERVDTPKLAIEYAI
jgi:hypothetical protein